MLKVEYVNVTDIRPCEQNPRKNDDNVPAVGKSMEAFGWTNPILVRKANGMIIAGHTRLKAAIERGLDKVPVIYLDLDETDAKAYMLADNKLTENAEWDGLKLAEIFAELDQLNVDLDLTGFSPEEIEDYVLGPMGEPQGDEDAIPEVQEEPISKPGDLWILGEHRLLCGDSTKSDDVERLMGGDKADMVFTDPPYGIDVVKGDKVGADFGVAKKGKYKRIQNDDTLMDVLFLLNLAEKVLIWGGNYFENLPVSGSWFVWDKRCDTGIVNTFADCELAWSNFGGPARVVRQLWNGMIREGEKGQRVHPTQKPINLFVDIIGKQEGNIVLDPFLGSGTTLIACEKLGRKCFGMEIDPHYNDVIIQRWEDYTGGKAVLEKQSEDNK